MNQQSPGFTQSSSPERAAEQEVTWSTTTGIAHDSELRRLLEEALLISKFSGEVCATLDPENVCAVAARALYPHLPYVRIVFSFPDRSGHRAIVMTPSSTEEERIVQLQRESRADGGSGATEWHGDPLLLNGSMHSRRFNFEVGKGSGSIEIFLDERWRPRISQEFADAVTEIFARALNNALEYDKVKEIAMRDGLTGVYNRRTFDEILAGHREHSGPSPLSLLLIDIDDFKKVNDTLGHPAGDQVLVGFSKILQQGCRGTDLVARYGGEEFALILPATTSSAAYHIAQRLRNRFAATTFVFEDRQLRLTASIGISCTSDLSGRPDEDLVSRADQALYRAKRTGKNKACLYTPTTPSQHAGEWPQLPRFSPARGAVAALSRWS